MLILYLVTKNSQGQAICLVSSYKLYIDISLDLGVLTVDLTISNNKEYFKNILIHFQTDILQ